MADSSQIIELYSVLADKPETDFGWDKGMNNAIAHNYSKEWFDKLPTEIWDYCAAVGNPFKVGRIDKGLTVVDLGCGAGVDLLISALLVGESGKAIGVDITPKMVQKAKHHAYLAGFKNVEVLESDFENLNIEDSSVDVVISNGAINLSSCKEAVFKEINRILKDDGKIYFADMIDISNKDVNICSQDTESSCCTKDEADWANCVAGTLHQAELIKIIEDAGFKDVECTGLTHYITSDTTKGATFKATKIPSADIRESHWNNLFQSVNYKEVLWYQDSPSKSLSLINSYVNKDASIIDVGCGTSLVVDNLLESNYKNLTLLDTSKKALEIVKQRIGKSNVKYIRNDILNFNARAEYDLWHDRAVFHFLTSKKDRDKYFEVLSTSLKKNGVAIISTFGIGGPNMCAGLNTIKYDDTKIYNQLPSSLELIEYADYIHITPNNSEQEYTYFIIKKV